MTDLSADDQQPFTPLAGLREAVLSAAAGAGGSGPSAAITLERPKRAEFGDYSTNAALLMAPGAGSPPRELAERIGSALGEQLGESLTRWEVAGPGFLNLFLSDAWCGRALAGIVGAGEGYGAPERGAGTRVLVEFVSANPTGPMHVGHARNAAYGDSLARMLAFAGERVEREFYVNDAGSQILKFGESIQAIARGEAVPEDGYHGEYMVPLAAQIADAATREPRELGEAGMEVMLERMKQTLRSFRVADFDHWTHETALHAGSPSAVERTLGMLAEQGFTYEQDGALWLATSRYGDDKDRVLVRSSGEHTYFASDIAYHLARRERGFEHQINIWGADHHGYVARMKAAYQALGGDPEDLELLIMQLVHLLQGGGRAQMSKRAGEFVTLEELIAEIGVDAARWYLLARSHDTTVELDLDLASRQSNENPVYYVQYAHARIASMLARAGEERVRAAQEHVTAERGANGGDPLHPSERSLILSLLAFPGELAESVKRRAPHRLAATALELAQGFTAFYRDCRVVGAEPETVESLRIALSVAAMGTIARCLELLGVSAPQRM